MATIVRSTLKGPDWRATVFTIVAALLSMAFIAPGAQPV
jgi:hypothetical protein